MGRPSNGFSSKQPTRIWSVVSNLCLLSPALLGIGCETSRSDISSSQQLEDSAKEDFDWAMMRLRRAIETFTPPASLGLKMTRKLSYELIPPDATRPHYTAQVIVNSKTAYQPKRFFSTTEGDFKQDETSRSGDTSAFAERLQADRANNPAASPEGHLEGTQTKALVVDALVDAPSIEERIVYELIYRDERWQLETLPDSKHEQMWFEYALQQ